MNPECDETPAYYYLSDDIIWYIISSLLGESHHETVERRIIYAFHFNF